MAQSSQSRFFYGWIVVGVTAMALLIAMGVRSSAGVFLNPMIEDTGWSTAEISGAVSIGLIMLGISGPVSGWLVGRYGPKVVMLGGLLLLAASTIVSSMVTSLWQLQLFWGALAGLGSGVLSSVMGPTIANRWFHTRRSFVVGIFGASTSAGQLLFFPLLIWLVSSMGWRQSSVVLGIVAAVATIPVLFLMRNLPSDVGQLPYGGDHNTVPMSLTADRDVMHRALVSPEFWLLAITFFVCGATSNGLIGTHLLKHAGDHGISAGVAAGMMSLMGSMNFVGTLFSGWLTDKYDPRKLLCIYYGFRGLSLLLLPFVSSALGLSVFAILFGLDYIATVPPTTALVADTFGRKNVGVVYGWVFCAHQIGAAMAAWMGGVARDALGDYVLAFLVAGVIAVLAGGLSLRIQRQIVPAAIST